MWHECNVCKAREHYRDDVNDDVNMASDNQIQNDIQLIYGAEVENMIQKND